MLEDVPNYFQDAEQDLWEWPRGSAECPHPAPGGPNPGCPDRFGESARVHREAALAVIGFFGTVVLAPFFTVVFSRAFLVRPEQYPSMASSPQVVDSTQGPGAVAVERHAPRVPAVPPRRAHAGETHTPGSSKGHGAPAQPENTHRPEAARPKTPRGVPTSVKELVAWIQEDIYAAVLAVSSPKRLAEIRELARFRAEAVIAKHESRSGGSR